MPTQRMGPWVAKYGEAPEVPGRLATRQLTLPRDNRHQAEMGEPHDAMECY
jgi:hypothetical protein